MSGPANAALIDVTWTGTVSVGNVGSAGAFGVADTFGGNELAGLAFTAAYRFDTTIGSLVQGAGFADLRGGSSFVLPGPADSATLTINGITVSFGSDTFGGYSRKSADGVSDINTEVDTSDSDILFLRVFRLDQNIPFAGLGETLTYNISGPDDGPHGVFQQIDGGVTLFNGNLAPTKVTIAPFVDPGPNPDPSNVPEPASMTLLGIGLAALGIARRRRERS